MRRRGWITGLMLACITGCAARSTPPDPSVVLTSTAPLYSLTLALTRNTSVTVHNLPSSPRSLATQAAWFRSRAEGSAELLKSADAVVSMAALWPEDPLFRTARRFNIRVVAIDATRPWSSGEGVSVAEEPRSSRDFVSSETPAGRSPYFWLSIDNALRSADLIAGDLARVFPGEATQIEANRAAIRSTLLGLQREAHQHFASLQDVTVFALTGRFVYLTGELGLFVDGYFLKQDIDWTDEDLQRLSTHLETHDVPVVIHQWQPDDRIAEAIQTAGARLVVLDTGELISSGEDPANALDNVLRRNLDRLYEAFVANFGQSALPR